MVEKYNDFRDMRVWQNSFSLLCEIYKLIKQFPKEELFCLTDQIKRASNSVVHNIAEGYGRFEPKDKTRFYKIAKGSAFETISQILVANSQSYISIDICEKMITKYKNVIDELTALIVSLEK